MKVKRNLPTSADARRHLKAGSYKGRKLSAAQRRIFRVIAKGGEPLQRKNNPAGLGQATQLIYDQVGGIWARMGQKHICDRKCKEVDHWYEHTYTEKFPIVGLPAGTVLQMPNGTKVKLRERRILI